ncbi:MAG: hypothetical protein JHC85_06910 [Chthoniobacterales bacterium]|nr:hypothetical protein [Chthoniobacterales bacterium]
MLISPLLFTFYIPTRHCAGEARASGSSYGEILQSSSVPHFIARMGGSPGAQAVVGLDRGLKWCLSIPSAEC